MKGLIVSGCLLFCIVSVSYACTPCAKVISFEDTLKETDLIIIGQKNSDGPRTCSGNCQGGPDWIEVKIIDVLKGKVEVERIRVNSWNGMCAYGIIIEDDKDYVLLLKQREESDDDSQFDAVYYCGANKYVLEGDFINLDGEKISVADFKKRLE